MTISVWALIALLAVHTFADFYIQTNAMAKNKSSSNFWLWLHVTAYSLFFWPFGIVLGFWGVVLFVMVNFVAHFATDYVTSRMTSKYWKAERRHAFFVTIGVDQAIHITTLVVTYALIRG